jgi:hypothetical protein
MVIYLFIYLLLLLLYIIISVFILYICGLYVIIEIFEDVEINKVIFHIGKYIYGGHYPTLLKFKNGEGILCFSFVF